MGKTSMSVMEMGKSLGLRKTESYWLVHKKQFETRIIAGQMRVIIKSFEHWYRNQLHYKKVNGEQPGEELLGKTMTVTQMAELLGISKDAAYKLIHNDQFKNVKTEYSSQRLLVDKISFYEWLNSQTKYSVCEENKEK